MLVNIVGGAPEGYLTVDEWASKHSVTPSAVRQRIFRGDIKPLTIGRNNYIKEDTPFPEYKKRGRKPNKSKS